MKNIEKKTKFVIDSEFFAMPQNKFVSRLNAGKFPLEKQEIEVKTPCLFVCFNISKFDKFLISSTIASRFVFINEETSVAIFGGTLTKEKYSKLLKSIKELKENDYSVVLINGQFPSIFGNNQKFTPSTVKFLFDTELDLRFLTFPGEYFANPMWSSKFRRCRTFVSQQLTVAHRKMIGYSEKELFESLNDVVPSTATIYSYKYPTQIRSNVRASNLERILYCCPKCKAFFTLYSEFSCVKCVKCSAATELSSDGQILFSKNIQNFDQIDEFLFKTLTTKGFDINALISYENIIIKDDINDKDKSSKRTTLEIFADKFVLTDPETKKQKTYTFEEIQDIGLSFDNTLVVTLSKNKQVILKGEGSENLYIMKDLHKLNKN